MRPELKADAESTPKQPVQLRSAADFSSLRGPSKRAAAAPGRQGHAPRPLKTPLHMPRAPMPMSVPTPVPVPAPSRARARNKPFVAGSTSPQPKLSVPATGQSTRPAAPRPQAAQQSTPVKSRSERPLRGPADEPTSAAARVVPTFTRADSFMPCRINGWPAEIVFSKAAGGLFVNHKLYKWDRLLCTLERCDAKGNYEVRLYENNVLRISFVLGYENSRRFKVACQTNKARAVDVGDHRPPESLNKLRLDSPRPEPREKSVDVTIIVDDVMDRTTITLKPQGLYVNNNMFKNLAFKKFEWSRLSIVRQPAPPHVLRVMYELYYDKHELVLKLGRNEAKTLDAAIVEHGVSTKAPFSSPDTSDEPVPPSPHKRTGPQSESSPKAESPASPTSPSQSSPVPSSLRERLRDLSKPLPKPAARPREPKGSGEEISPQAFYGKTEDRSGSAGSAGSAGSPTPKATNGTSRTDPINLTSPTDPINLTSPEKPARRLRRRARPDVEELNENAPVEPTSEDFQLLRDAGFHRVSHRFWDGRLMEVSVEDIARLNPRIYVNDNIIWFFLRWYLEQLYLQDRTMFDKILLLNTFFYPEVRKGESPKWVTKLPILSKHITIMPIHEAAHWSVAVIIGLDEALQPESTTKPTVVVLDSLGPTQNHQTFRKVVSVLRCVLRMHNKPQLTTRDYRALRTTVPVQTNLTDCGVYLLHYVEQIFERPDVFLNQVSSAQDRTLDMGEFWREPELHSKRDDLKRRLKRLGSEENSAEVAHGTSDQDDDIEVVGMEQVRRKRRKVGSVPEGISSQDTDSSILLSGAPAATVPAESMANGKNDAAKGESAREVAGSEKSALGEAAVSDEAAVIGEAGVNGESAVSDEAGVNGESAVSGEAAVSGEPAVSEGTAEDKAVEIGIADPAEIAAKDEAAAGHALISEAAKDKAEIENAAHKASNGEAVEAGTSTGEPAPSSDPPASSDIGSEAQTPRSKRRLRRRRSSMDSGAEIHDLTGELHDEPADGFVVVDAPNGMQAHSVNDAEQEVDLSQSV